MRILRERFSLGNASNMAVNKNVPVPKAAPGMPTIVSDPAKKSELNKASPKVNPRGISSGRAIKP